jgi:hypothetical protein
MPFVLLLASVFQENAISPQTVVSYMFIVGSFGGGEITQDEIKRVAFNVKSCTVKEEGFRV